MRYYCDFCKKSGAQASAIKRHELACTLNPSRVCKMCVAGDTGTQKPIADLKLALLSDIKLEQNKVVSTDTFQKYELLVIDPKQLREVSDGCPACMLSAIRQLEEAEKQYIQFVFADEVKSFWEARKPRGGDDY